VCGRAAGVTVEEEVSVEVMTEETGVAESGEIESGRDLESFMIKAK
jgi:hypothetical protein